MNLLYKPPAVIGIPKKLINKASSFGFRSNVSAALFMVSGFLVVISFYLFVDYIQVKLKIEARSWHNVCPCDLQVLNEPHPEKAKIEIWRAY